MYQVSSSGIARVVKLGGIARVMKLGRGNRTGAEGARFLGGGGVGGHAPSRNL